VIRDLDDLDDLPVGARPGGDEAVLLEVAQVGVVDWLLNS
jgi:hypothetical protein